VISVLSKVNASRSALRGMPGAVSRLEPADMIKGTMNCGDRHCLSGWVNFEFKHEPTRDYVRQLLLAEIQAEIGSGWSIIGYMDGRTSLKRSAALWNRVIRFLGFTVDV